MTQLMQYSFDSVNRIQNRNEFAESSQFGFRSTNQDLFKTNFLKTLFLCFAIFETRNACVIIYVSEFHQGTKLENGQA